METLSANDLYSSSGHSQPSHVREPRNPTIHHQKATRAMQPAVQQQQQQYHNRGQQQHPSLSAPASQESIISVQSAASSVPPRLQDSETNLSQITSYTDLTSPSSSVDSQAARDASHLSKLSQIQRNKTPDNQLQPPQCNGDSALALASPMSTTSPALTTNGAKRTASGHVKSTPSLSNTPYSSSYPARDSRRESTSSSGSRAGELAATLKTRLGYAMAKVHNGWEHKQLHEVEQLAMLKDRQAQSKHQSRPSTSGLSNGTARMSMHDDYHHRSLDEAAQPPSKRHSGTYASFVQSSQHSRYPSSQGPRLQPAADIRPTSSSQPYPEPSLSQAFQSHGSAMSPPRTPSNAGPRRPPTIRTETQTLEAERDALQALFQLGSPHTSQMPRSATATSSHASPPNGMLDTPRRVTFARSESNSSARPSSSGSSAAQDHPARYVESQR